MNRDNICDMTVFALLLLIGVVGRWAQPAWNFTPLAAIAAVGSFYFSRASIALLLPISALLISHWLLPSYGDWMMFASVLALILVPVAIGRTAKNTAGFGRLILVAMCGVVPATAFYLVTNFLVWTSTGLYDQSLAGMVSCYSAAIPFYRAMLLGDLFYLGLFLAIGWTTQTAGSADSASVRRALA